VPKRPRFERRCPSRVAILACATALLVGFVDAVDAQGTTQGTVQSGRSRRPAPDSARTPSDALRSVALRLARNDSLGALAVLDSAIGRDRRNGVLWNRYGQIAWGMSKTEKGPVMRPEMVRLRMRADSAFRYAMAFAPDSAQYFIDMGRYALEANIVTLRAGAKGNFADGLKVARAQGRTDLASQLIDQLGMVEWTSYDNVVHRALEKSPDEYVNFATQRAEQLPGFGNVVQGERSAVAQNTANAGNSVRRGDFAAFYRERLSVVSPPTGETDFINALRQFREAAALDPDNATAQRHVYMALAEKRSWNDLLEEANRRLRRNADDGDALLARGIAASSLEDYENAASAFSQALQRMTPPERSAFTNVKRVLAPSIMDKSARFADSVRWNALTPVERQRQETLFWNLVDPRASTRTNEAMVEFFARVAYADLRFGSVEYRVRGADSPRGDTWVRYGPPDAIYSLPRMGYTDIIWVYALRKLVFTFRMRSEFGTANYAFEDLSVDSLHAERPVDWDNMPLARRTWPMRARVARFRSSSDSMDAVITATVPVRSFLAGAELAGPLPINVQLDVHDPQSRIVGREVRRVNVSADSLPVGINGTWVRRIGRGPNVVRIDAEQADVKRAATAQVDAVVDSSSGFGISDLLLGTNPQRVGGKDPVRWSDVSLAPTTAVFPWAQAVGVVWEAYDLTPENGSVRYKVNLQLARTFESTMKGFIARVAAYTKNVIERDGSGTGSVQVTYEQTRPAGPIITDFLAVNLRGSVPGTYRLTIEIEDLVAKRTTRRTTTFDLTPD
jgi:GWxTD domain-containing protein